MSQRASSQYEEVSLVPEDDHEVHCQPEQTIEPQTRQVDAMAEGSLSSGKDEASDVTPKYEKGCLVPLKTWRNHGGRALLAFAYRTNGYKYSDDSHYRHRDFANRVEMLQRHDAHLSIESGELYRLIVQCTDDVYANGHVYKKAQAGATWCRTYVRKPSPYYVRLASWTVGHSHGSKSYTDSCAQILRAFPAALATIAVCLGGFASSSLYYGKYPPVFHKYWGDAKVWSNSLENSRKQSQLSRKKPLYRQLRPRNLCLLTDNGWRPINVAHWEERDPGNVGRTLSYLFVAYSSEQFNHDRKKDMEDLHKIGMAAAKHAGVDAFWIGASCMRDEAELENDMYRISDVLRGAESMIIAVNPSKYDDGNALPLHALQVFGSRVWTFPEVLLSPGKDILVYIGKSDLSKPYNMSKNQVASVLWGDRQISRQLIDHYLGTITLSRIELAVLALRCLYARETKSFSEGDHAYALMGLLRLRPPVDTTDSQFQAFARLSLANDSDKLLERYICTLPKKADQPWHDMTDAYHSSLWDIDPVCQVAAICDNDTVVLDGARGATIEWSKFGSIWYATRPTWKRKIASTLVRFSWVFLVVGIVLGYCSLGPLLESWRHTKKENDKILKDEKKYCFLFDGTKVCSDDDPSLGEEVNYDAENHAKLFHYLSLGLGVPCLVIWFASALVGPLLVRTMLAGKIRDIQGAFYGVEGYLNPETVEGLIFGMDLGRFKWSSHGSLLSRALINEHKERVGIDPCVDDDTKEKIEAARLARPGDMRIFTLVDTCNLEVTIFEAVRPPNVLIFCGREGGMQRAVGCSYDWTTQTFHRETVLRMPTESLERASRMSRFRMGIQRPDWDTIPVKSEKRTIGRWRNKKASLLDELR